MANKKEIIPFNPAIKIAPHAYVFMKGDKTVAPVENNIAGII